MKVRELIDKLGEFDQNMPFGYEYDGEYFDDDLSVDHIAVKHVPHYDIEEGRWKTHEAVVLSAPED